MKYTETHTEMLNSAVFSYKWITKLKKSQLYWWKEKKGVFKLTRGEALRTVLLHVKMLENVGIEKNIQYHGFASYFSPHYCDVPILLKVVTVSLLDKCATLIPQGLVCYVLCSPVWHAIILNFFYLWFAVLCVAP